MKKRIFTLILLLGLSTLFVQAQETTGVTNLGHPEVSDQTPFGLYNKNTILSAADGTIWYNTDPFYIPNTDSIIGESYLVNYNDGVWTVFQHANTPVLPRKINAIAETENTIYVGTPSGLLTYNGSWQEVEALQNQPIHVVYTDTDTKVVGTDNGLFILEGETWVNYNTVNSDLCYDTITSLEKTSDNKLWIGTKSGISVLDGTTWQTINSENSDIGDNDILSLKADLEDKMWIGTQNAGVYIYASELAQSVFALMPYNEPAHKNTKAIAIDSEGTAFFVYKSNDGYRLMMINGDDYRLSVYPFSRYTPLFAGSEEALYFSKDLDLLVLNKKEINQVNNVKNLDINNVGVDFTSVGKVAWQIGVADFPVFRIPKGSMTSTVFTGNLWMGGMDETGTLHLAGETFNQEGYDYWPGPVSNSEAVYEAEKQLWNRAWKLSQEEIDYHKENWFQPDYVPNPDILNWPAHGNPEYGQMELIAPYMDLQSNGIYEPMAGDYPMIRGDEAIFFIFNDDRLAHGESGGNRIGVEVHGMAYAYNQPESEALNHTIFINYQIINRSDKVYSDFYVSKFTDFDIGYGFDDFIGCDTLLQSFYSYNALPVDGSGEPESYGENPPAQAVSFLNQPLSSFVYFNNCASGPTCGPNEAEDYYYNMQAMWKDGSHVLYGGTGHSSGAGTTDNPTNYMYSGNPVSSEGWSEITENNDPGDRRGIGNMHIGDFEPNDRICLDLAYVYGRSDAGHLESINSMKANIAEIRDFYAINIDGSCVDLIPTNTTEIGGESQLPRLFPNPATNTLYVSFDKNEKVTATIFNSLGQLARQIDTQGTELQFDLSKLENGMYILKLQTSDKSFSYKFVKQE